MFALLFSWWWPVLLLAVPYVACTIAGTIARRTDSAFDHAIPDTLPATAGRWLASRISQRGLPVESVVAEGSDAYFPDSRVIRLAVATHFKADPVYWAIAAHELGHARWRIERPLGTRIRRLADAARILLVAVGLALAFTGVLYGLPHVLANAHGALIVAAALSVVILVEEAIASVFGYRELVACGQLGRRDLRAARWVLVAAFATYVAWYGSYALLLTQWSFVEDLAITGGGELTRFGTIVAAVASVVILGYAWLRFVRFARPPSQLTLGSALAGLGFVLATLTLVSLAWDQSSEPLLVGSVALAVAATWRLWAFLLQVPLLPIEIAVAVIARRFRGKGVHETVELVRARSLGVTEIVRGKRRLEELHASPRGPLSYRLATLAVACTLPLVVVFWTL